MEDIRRELHKFPKGDVHNHLHLGGDRRLLKKRYGAYVPTIPITYDGLSGMIAYINTEISKLLKTKEDVFFLMDNAMQTSISDNVVYLEASIDLALSRFFDDSVEKLIEAVEKIKIKYRSEIDFRPDLGINKDYPIDSIYTDAPICISSGVFNGIDLYGREQNQSLGKFAEVFNVARNENLKTKVHIGEFSSHETIEDAIHILNPDEIQHGIRAVDSKTTMQMIREKNIQLNVCPQSNRALGAVEEESKNPIRELFDNGIQLTINTDDHLLFNASLTDQYLYLLENAIFSFDEIQILRKNALNARVDGVD